MRKLKDRPHALKITGHSRTEQAHANDVDINQIMAKAQAGQHSDYIKDHGGEYMDATSVDFFEAQIVVANANSLFADLPSAIRNKFDNNPGDFLDFVQNPENLEEMYDLKLAVRPIVPIEPTPPAPIEPEKTEAAPAAE